MMRDAAISARLVAKAHSNDNEWKERLRIIRCVNNAWRRIIC